MDQRRIRQNPHIRELTSEVVLTHKKLIQPYFVVDGITHKEPISGLTEVYRETSESLLRQVELDMEKGIRKTLLFGVPKAKKSKEFSFDFVCDQISLLKKNFGKDLFLSVDVCLCSYTESGHCGFVNEEHQCVDNELSVATLAEQALQFAQAGADCVAPSDMMDGRVKAIRTLLDQQKQSSTLIMSYSAKFHSKFYGPFRLAADSAPKSQIKDRSTYQIDPSHFNDAFLSSERDEKEGADILMVKPGLPYLDVLFRLSQSIKKPWAVYEVSGEYAAIELLAEKGLISREQAHLEAWTSFFRAGADMVITYGARHALDWINKN